jgi:FAD synthase
MLNNSDEPGLWMATPRHRVELMLPDDPPERARSLGVRCLVAHTYALDAAGISVDQWLEKYHATLLSQFTMVGTAVDSNAPPNYMRYYVAWIN